LNFSSSQTPYFAVPGCHRFTCQRQSMAYQVATRFHVSDVQAEHDGDILEEQLATGSIAHLNMKRWTLALTGLALALAHLALIVGFLLSARRALQQDGAVLDNFGVLGNGSPAVQAKFLQVSQEALNHCVTCVETGRSWQAGQCNPSSACMIADMGCFQDAEGCEQWRQEEEAIPKCAAQNDCIRCLAIDLCMWQSNSGCFMGSDFWGPPETVIKEKERCQAPEVATHAESATEPAGHLVSTVA